MAPPAIMHKYGLDKPLAEIGFYCFEAPVFGSDYESGLFILPGPKPIFLPVYFHARFIGAHHFAPRDFLPDMFVRGKGFFGKPGQDMVQASFAYGQGKHVPEDFFHPVKRDVLPTVPVTDQTFHPGAIADGGVHALWETAFRDMSTVTGLFVDTVFGMFR